MIDVLICGIGGKMGENLVGVLKDDEGARVVCGVDLHPAAGEIPVYSSFNGDRKSVV